MKTKIIIIILLPFLFSATPVRQYGKVKYYNEEKGFGYIVDNKTQDEIFVYEEKIIDEIKDNDLVVYEVRNTRKGYEAYNVRKK